MKYAIAIAAAVAVGASIACTTPATPADTTPPPSAVAYPPASRLGVYEGPGDTTEVNSFQSWLGRDQVDATDYVDPSENATWNTVAFKKWGDWRQAKEGRRFVLGLPLVPKTGSLYGTWSGRYDAQFRELARLMKANGLGDSVIRLGYEANNPNIGPWQAATSSDRPWYFREAFKRIQRIMDTESPALKFDLNFASGNSGSASTFTSLYPGDSYVDYVGLNVYDVHYGVTQSAYSRWQYALTRNMGINQFKSFAAAHGKPVSYPEWGLYKTGDSARGGGDNPYFIEKMAELTKGAVYQAYFNESWGGGTLDNFPNGKARYKQLFGGNQ